MIKVIESRQLILRNMYVNVHKNVTITIKNCNKDFATVKQLTFH